MFTALIRQVEANCELASSQQAGSFSLCGLLMRLRLLYKWKHGLPPWREPEPEEVLAWVATLEAAWDAREGESCQELRVNGLALDPFNVEQVNAVLKPAGLVYGAGLCRDLAPTFFLGELSQVRQDEGLTILVMDRELARDLDGTPALRQGNLIYARRQALAYYLWDRLADPSEAGNRFLKAGWARRTASLAEPAERPRGASGGLGKVFRPGNWRPSLPTSWGKPGKPRLAQALPAILELFPHTPLSHWIRAMKDALADVSSSGRLGYFIAGRRLRSFALMLAFQPGFYPLLLPELEPAFFTLTTAGDWEVVEQARLTARARLLATAPPRYHGPGGGAPPRC